MWIGFFSENTPPFRASSRKTRIETPAGLAGHCRMGLSERHPEKQGLKLPVLSINLQDKFSFQSVIQKNKD